MRSASLPPLRRFFSLLHGADRVARSKGSLFLVSSYLLSAFAKSI
ncbi:hypothetical protein B8V81_1577 [Paenibacillus pasadenensis]|uniref:Uncharacterized protein n=1 Tax=Paenibacillus pasadenensis TaxID=217090 RepID=A0A2N5NAJ7_9BACL|nr:hypothetical protein B8V81_1577 [Paenibacillus pasadenensis]